MRLQKWNKILFLFFAFAPASFAQSFYQLERDIPVTPTPTPPPFSFRAPAKLYGSAYSIKVTVKRDGTEFVAPFWVKPDQVQSTIDLKQFAELGWYYPDLKMDELKISGDTVAAPVFKNAKADWAFVPDFPKTCCYGVIGQDILKKYETVFSPRLPMHIEFTPLENAVPAKSSTKMPRELSSLFSVASDQRTVDGKKVDLSDVPYRLNFSKNEFELIQVNDKPEALALRRAQPIFNFTILPPWRKLKITSMPSAVATAAKKVGLKTGMIIWSVQNKTVLFLDKFEVDRIFKGRRDPKITIDISDDVKSPKRRTVFFDFKTNEFSQ